MPACGIYNETGQGRAPEQWDAIWKASIAVSPGDFVFRDTDGYDKPVSSYTWNTDIATTAGALNILLRGVSMARRLAAQATDGGKADGNILKTGEFCFPCAALGSAAAPGALVTFAKQASANLVDNQAVAVTATIGQAFGRVTRDAPVGQTFLFFELLLPLLYGGPTAPA